jgi:hypothetical protein
MESTMKQSERQKKIKELEHQQAVDNFESNLSRARSVMVGTAFGGSTEISMRADGGRHIWAILQPVEVVELINQLSANIGCHINIKPRDDFASWREWNITDQAKLHANGHAPVTDNFNSHKDKALNLPEPKNQPGLKIPKESDHEPTMATKKTVNGRSTKRASKTS